MNTRVDVPSCTLLLQIPGDLTSTTVPPLRATISAQLDDADLRPAVLQTVHLDLRHASMVDSMGLNLIVAVLKRVKAHGGKTIALIGHRNVERTLIFTRLNAEMQLVRVDTA